MSHILVNNLQPFQIIFEHGNEFGDGLDVFGFVNTNHIYIKPDYI
jgi:hypothetical protein